VVPKGVLDQSIFERMESDDDHSSTGPQSFRKAGGKEGLEVFEFVVDGNSQGLKDAGCWVLLRPVGTAAGMGRGDGFDQVGGSSNRVARAAIDDRSGD
jgi:hypothetical protein